MSENVMTVRTERTPNPNSLKYNLGVTLLPGSSANFPSAESAERSPLAKRIFKVSGVVGVFIGPNFITVTKEAETSWNDVNIGVAPALEAFFETGEQVLQGAKPADYKEIGADTADPGLVEQIKSILDERVRPAVAQDGGDIIYRGYEDGVVYLEMIGACSGCPSSSATLKGGVERLLQESLPEDVKEVRQV